MLGITISAFSGCVSWLGEHTYLHTYIHTYIHTYSMSGNLVWEERFVVSNGLFSIVARLVREYNRGEGDRAVRD